MVVGLSEEDEPQPTPQPTSHEMAQTANGQPHVFGLDLYDD